MFGNEIDQIFYNVSVETDQGYFDPELLHNLKRVAQQSFSTMSELGDQLIEEWSPFGPPTNDGVLVCMKYSKQVYLH
jgi:hypothetical protein